MKINGRILALVTTVSALSLSGCMSSPTYGTSKTANQQLIDDMTNIVAIGSSKETPEIDRKPRPELVRPAANAQAVLLPPQESVASSGSSLWPESPEERRKRLRDEVTANRDNVGFVSPIISDAPVSGNGKSGVTWKEGGPDPISLDREKLDKLQRQRQEQKIGGADRRRYLSEPPITYRQPAATAATGELGEDESVKERQRKAAARGSKSWKEYLPWN